MMIVSQCFSDSPEAVALLWFRVRTASLLTQQKFNNLYQCGSKMKPLTQKKSC